MWLTKFLTVFAIFLSFGRVSSEPSELLSLAEFLLSAGAETESDLSFV